MHSAYRAGSLALLACACVACDVAAPPPTVSAITPAVACGGRVTTLAVTGAGFRVRVVAVLGDPASEGPTVSLAAGGSSLALATRWRSSEALDADVAADAPAAGVYDVVVTNPDGASARLAAALTRGSTPRIDTATPPQICTTGGTLDVRGDGFVAGARAHLVDPLTAARIDATAVDVTAATRLGATFGANSFAADAALDLTVENPDGCATTLAGGVRLRKGTGGCP